MSQQYAHRQLYQLEFSDADWEELQAMSFEPFEVVYREALSRIQWMALAEMALGKAQLIDEGRYDMGLGDDDDSEEWADQLRTIARQILERFRPGDGQI